MFFLVRFMRWNLTRRCFWTRFCSQNLDLTCPHFAAQSFDDVSMCQGEHSCVPVVPNGSLAAWVWWQTFIYATKNGVIFFSLRDLRESGKLLNRFSGKYSLQTKSNSIMPCQKDS